MASGHRLATDEHDPAPRGLAPPAAAAEGDRFAGDDRGRCATDVHGVGVHDPRHRLLVGVHVRCGHVAVRTEDVDDGRRVAARDALELADGELARIADHATLAAAEGDVDDRALPRHPGREGAHLVDVHIGREANAALAGATQEVVLDSVAGEDPDRPVVHAHRQRDGQLAFRCPQQTAQSLVEVQQVRSAVEQLLHRGEGIELVGLCLLRDDRSVRHRECARRGGDGAGIVWPEETREGSPKDHYLYSRILGAWAEPPNRYFFSRRAPSSGQNPRWARVQ